ncbi:prolyl-tRNA synthetase associated domain-containing protein 1-like [Papaver somniferum]|uniref:prolyl-tRNA synthetase associated domain-containing protein 1-like n=1 Tax=Papaver somniferum TaxID=3469 RepID=UPI000E700A99|nr:prolyl-tRNA synthetase associated domain-containing protein 1-like [Papaver somniferum]
MGYTKDQLLQRLQELQIDFVRHDHPVVLTVEEQAKYVGHLEGGLSKNLFLKDKKSRYYVVSALAATNVDLKVLSVRLGLGKGGLRMAPVEGLEEILQVPLGCVTPFALVNDSARNVTLLLDQGFKTQKCCYFHPLSNDVTISLSTGDLDKFLISIGKDPSYVDLEANPKVGKDQPPDLASLVTSVTPILIDQPENTATAKPSTSNDVPTENKPKVAAGKASSSKQSNNVPNVKEKSKNAAQPSINGADVGKFVDEIIDKASSLVLSEINEKSTEQQGEQLASSVSSALRKRLSLDLESLAMMFKNTAVTQGFLMGTRAQSGRNCPP